MKKPGICVLLMLTVLFTGFICGFFIGRNTGHSDIQLSVLQPSKSAETTPSSETETMAPVLSDPAGPGEIDGNDTTSPSSIVNGKVNINAADIQALTTLPGIGEVLAQRIIDYREANGPFSSLSDLMMVDGIGEKRLDAIWDYITLGG